MNQDEKRKEGFKILSSIGLIKSIMDIEKEIEKMNNEKKNEGELNPSEYEIIIKGDMDLYPIPNNDNMIHQLINPNWDDLWDLFGWILPLLRMGEKLIREGLKIFSDQIEELNQRGLKESGEKNEEDLQYLKRIFPHWISLRIKGEDIYSDLLIKRNQDYEGEEGKEKDIRRKLIPFFIPQEEEEEIRRKEFLKNDPISFLQEKEKEIIKRFFLRIDSSLRDNSEDISEDYPEIKREYFDDIGDSISEYLSRMEISFLQDRKRKSLQDLIENKNKERDFIG